MLFLEQARALSSIGMGALFLTALFTTGPKDFIKNIWRNKSFLFLSLVFIQLIFGFLDSNNYQYLLERLQVKIPFLLLPFAFASLRPFSHKAYMALLNIFLWTVGLVAIGCYINYLQNYEEINEAYLHSKVMPAPINHVRFSLIMAFSIFLGAWLYAQNTILRFRWEKYINVFLTLFIVFFLHVYSVRSGMLAFYAGLSVFIIYLILKKRKYKTGFSLIGLMILCAILAYNFSSTLRNKIENSKEDLKVYRTHDNPNDYPMGTRFISYEAAQRIWSENKLFGSGAGDLTDRMEYYYTTEFQLISRENRIIPHNQFIYYLAATGIFGLIIFSLSFFLPLFIDQNYKNFLLSIHYLIVFVSFLFEATLENQLGVAFCIMFILLPLNQQKRISEK